MFQSRLLYAGNEVWFHIFTRTLDNCKPLSFFFSLPKKKGKKKKPTPGSDPYNPHPSTPSLPPSSHPWWTSHCAPPFSHGYSWWRPGRCCRQCSRRRRRQRPRRGESQGGRDCGWPFLSFYLFFIGAFPVSIVSDQRTGREEFERQAENDSWPIVGESVRSAKILVRDSPTAT